MIIDLFRQFATDRRLNMIDFPLFVRFSLREQLIHFEEVALYLRVKRPETTDQNTLTRLLGSFRLTAFFVRYR